MHQYSIDRLKPSRIKITITGFDKATLEKSEKKALQALSSEVKLKGFRPGKVPEAVIREQLEPQYIDIRTIEKALPIALDEIVQHEKLRLVGEPKVHYEKIKPLTITFESDLFPDLKLGDYSQIKVTVKEKKATNGDERRSLDKEVDEALELMKSRMTEYVPVDRAAKVKDRVTVDFEGCDQAGKTIPHTASKHYPIVLGSKMLIPGFEEELVGLKKNDVKSFTIRFPKDYHAKNLANAEVTFKVSVGEVEEAKIPDINEAFIERMSGKKQPLLEWKESIKAQIQEQHRLEMNREREESYYKALIKLITGELPKTMRDEEKQNILREIKQQILYQGLSFETYLRTLKKTEEELLQSFDTQAEDRLKLRIALQIIAEKENIEVNELELEESLNEMKANKKDFAPGSPGYTAIRYQLKMKKTLQKLLSQA